MFALITAIIFSIIIVMSILLIFGAPLGEFTMGGQHKILPKNLRIMAVFSLAVQVFGLVTVLQAGGLIPLLFSAKVTQIICIVFAAYLSLNTIMCLISKSKKEKYVMTPLALLSAIGFWITAFQM